MKSHSPTIERRFSRKALNIMTISVAIAIFLLSRTYTDSVSTTTSSTDKSPQENTSANLRPHLLDIKTQALNTAQPPITLPIQTWRHDTGAQLLFVESSEIPMLNIELIFDAGSARDTDLPGLARMTNNLIGEGSTQHSVEEIAQTFESLGSEFNTASERDMGVLSLKTLASDANLQASLNLFIEVLSQPSFPEAALTRVKKMTTISLAQEKASPHELISKATWRALYGEHPYAQHPKGTDASLERITPERLAQFHRTHYTAANATIAIVGAINWNRAKEIAEKIIAALPAGSPLPPLPSITEPASTEHIHIEFPSQQTHIRIATLSTNRHDKRLIPLIVANEVLGGGGFTSQLNKVIRQDKGLAYSVYSYAGAMQSEGVFVIDLQTQNDSAAQALELAEKTLATFIEKGPSAQDLEKATKHLVASFPLGLSTNNGILRQLANMGFYHLPKNYLELYTKQILDTTPQTAQRVFSDIIHPGKHLIITLGPTPPEST